MGDGGWESDESSYANGSLQQLTTVRSPPLPGCLAGEDCSPALASFIHLHCLGLGVPIRQKQGKKKEFCAATGGGRAVPALPQMRAKKIAFSREPISRTSHRPEMFESFDS